MSVSETFCGGLKKMHGRTDIKSSLPNTPIKDKEKNPSPISLKVSKLSKGTEETQVPIYSGSKATEETADDNLDSNSLNDDSSSGDEKNSDGDVRECEDEQNEENLYDHKESPSKKLNNTNGGNLLPKATEMNKSFNINFHVAATSAPALARSPIRSTIRTTNDSPSIYKTPEPKSGSSGINFLVVSCVLVAVLVTFGSSFWSTVSGPTISTASSPSSVDKQKELALRRQLVARLETALGELKAKYNQTDMFWAQIESSFKHSVINGKDPSIVMLVSDPLTHDLAHRLVLDILETLNRKVLQRTWSSQFVIDPVNDSSLAKLIRDSEFDRAKLEVDTRLGRVFSSDEKLALVQNIQKMPALVMLLFYTYGDYENAKFPGVLTFMGLNLQHSLSAEERERFESKTATLTEFVEGYLFNLWKNQIAADQLKPLFTRIANNLCFVRSD